MQIEVAYVGRFSHRLLSLDDMAMPTDIFDKASGLDYFKAVTAWRKFIGLESQTGTVQLLHGQPRGR